MPDATSFLTRKIGPLPLWTYGLAAAAVVALFALYKRGQSSLQSSSSASPIPASPYASSDQGLLNYPPTVVVTPAGTTNTQPAATQPSGQSAPTQLQPGSQAKAQGSGQPALVVRPGGQGQPWQQDGYIPDQSVVTVTGPPIPAVWSSAPAGQSPNFLAVPISFAGRNTWINAIGLQPAGGGGGHTVVTHAVPGHGPLWHFVPFQPQQFVHTGRGGGDGMGEGDGMGGGGGMGAITRRTGIPLIRLRSLNYHLRRGDGSYAPGIVRIA